MIELLMTLALLVQLLGLAVAWRRLRRIEAQVMGHLSPIGDILPPTERQAVVAVADGAGVGQ